MAPIIEKLDEVDEVWALCVRVPAPGGRLLGRFAEQGTFVALSAYDRHELASRRRYMDAAISVIGTWANLFGDQAPHRGETLEDYVGGLVINANED